MTLTHVLLCASVDRCSTGGSGTASVACPPETDGSYFPTCPPVQQDGSCSAGGQGCMPTLLLPLETSYLQLVIAFVQDTCTLCTAMAQHHVADTVTPYGTKGTGGHYVCPEAMQSNTAQCLMQCCPWSVYGDPFYVQETGCSLPL